MTSKRGMTEKEALAKARELWGVSARVWRYGRNGEVNARRVQMSATRIKGIGRTWEEAFEDAGENFNDK